MTEWVIVVLYVPASAPAGIVTVMAGFQLAVLVGFTPVAICTGPDGKRGLRLLAMTAAVPVTVADGVT
jgi:hypothetical protein